MSEVQNREYNKLIEQAEGLKKVTFANELSQICAWENLLTKLFTLAAEVRPKVTMFFLINFTKTEDSLQKVFEDLVMVIKAYSRPPVDKKKPATVMTGPPGIKEDFPNFISFDPKDFPKGFACPKKEEQKEKKEKKPYKGNFF